MSKFGPFKALELNDGTKVNVSEKSKFYNVFDESGNYEIQIGTSQKGNAMVVAATKLDANGSNSENTAALKPTYSPAAQLAKNTAMSQNLDKKIDFEKDKQKDIMIQCYIGRAIDILSVTKHDVSFSVDDVVEIARQLIAGHRSLAINANTKSLTENPTDSVSTVQTGDDSVKFEEDHERVPDEKPTTQEDIPF